MCQQDRYYKEKEIINFCAYCRSPIYEGDSYIVVDGCYYHYSKDNRLENCYFPEDYEE
jgi:hypothetical protein